MAIESFLRSQRTTVITIARLAGGPRAYAASLAAGPSSCRGFGTETSGAMSDCCCASRTTTLYFGPRPASVRSPMICFVFPLAGIVDSIASDQPSMRDSTVADHGPTLPVASAQRPQYTTIIGARHIGGVIRIGLRENDRRYHGRPPSFSPGRAGTGSSGPIR